MDKTYDIKKIGGDKIALLGLFVLSLLIARLIVASKSALILSEPIILAHAGLSVSMPSGNGWKSEKRWKYHENASSFSLSSSFAPGSGKPTAWAHCRYLLAAETTTPQMRFTAKLPNNHQLDIEVHQIMGDAEMAELTFKRIVKSLNFESTTAEDIIRKFPERAEYIRRQASLSGLRTNKMLK